MDRPVETREGQRIVYDVVDAQGRVTETVEVGADGRERIVESHRSAGGERVVERAGGERVVERVVERAAAERPGGERVVERVVERAAAERPGGDRVVERVVERAAAERPGGDRVVERVVERAAAERPGGDRVVERAEGERGGDRVVERVVGHGMRLVERRPVHEAIIMGPRAASLSPLLGGISGEHRELFNRVNLGSYLAAVTEQRAVTGAEAELQQALRLSTGGSSIEVPLALLARGMDGINGRVLQQRVDTASTFPDDAGPKQEGTYTPAVFPTSLMARLAMIQVLDIGEAVHITMATSAQPAAVAPGVDHDATAAVWTTKVASPVRVPARFIYRLEDAVRLVNVEPRLTMDIMAALQSAIDKLGVAGGSPLLTSNGIIGSLGATETTDLSDVADPAAATDAHRRAAYVKLIEAALDGLYAEAMSDVGYYFTPPFYRAMLGMGHPDTDKTLHDQLRATGAMVSGSRHVGNAALGANKIIGLIARRRGIETAAHLSIWPTARFTRDEVTRAQAGEVVLTVNAMIDVTVGRKENFHLVKTA